MQVEILPLAGDNYIYLVVDGGSAAVIDPSSAGLVFSALSSMSVNLELVLITHNHADHTAGCGKLKSETGCCVYGSGRSFDQEVSDGDTVSMGNNRLTVLSVPGHTTNDVAYYSVESKAVFTGDTLFAGGCGRVFSGDNDRMWKSLKTLRDLPDDTLVYCGHEYTVDNMEFAADLEPGNKDVEARLKVERAKVSKGEPTVPSTMRLEKETNPFLRCDDEAFQEAIGITGTPAEVFATIRSRKNSW